MVSLRSAAGWLLVGAAGVPSLQAQSRDWSPDDRAIVGDFTVITAVAAGEQLVYAATPDAVIAWDPQGRRWQGPFTPPAATFLSGVTAALADPVDQSLWLVQRTGWARFDPQLRLWEQGALPGGVIDAALDRNNPAAGLFLRSPAGWFTAARGAPIATPAGAPKAPLRPASPNDAVRSNPALAANAAAVLRTGHLQGSGYTCAAIASGFTGRGWYIGTAGAGLLYLPEGAALPERLTFGLPGASVGAVFAVPGGVWVATERGGGRDPGLSFVSGALDRFDWHQGSWTRGFPFTQVRRLVGQGNSLWLASDAGLIRLVPSSDQLSIFDEGRGLPDRRVIDVTARRGRVVAGLVHGLVTLGDSGEPRRLAPSFTGEADAVLVSPDTVWVGTRLGLLAALPEEGDLVQPAALAESPALRDPVVALAWRGDTLVALLRDRLLWRDPVKGGFSLGPPIGSAVGRLHRLINTPDGLFVAGDRGFGRVALNQPLGRPILTPGDLPAEVTDLAADDTYLWVATLRGLVRFRLEAVAR